jgi:hypothetical protein
MALSREQRKSCFSLDLTRISFEEEDDFQSIDSIWTEETKSFIMQAERRKELLKQWRIQDEQRGDEDTDFIEAESMSDIVFLTF